jgi:hypothetical protein
VKGFHNRVNTTENRFGLGQDARQRLVDLYTPDVRALSAWLPDFDMGLWPNFASVGIA